VCPDKINELVGEPEIGEFSVVAVPGRDTEFVVVCVNRVVGAVAVPGPYEDKEVVLVAIDEDTVGDVRTITLVDRLLDKLLDSGIVLVAIDEEIVGSVRITVTLVDKMLDESLDSG